MTERLDKLETMMKRLVRRSPKHYTGVIPPAIVSMYCGVPQSDGHLFTFLCPIKGNLKSVGLYIKELVKAKDLHCAVTHQGLMDSAYTINLITEKQVVDVSFQINRGDLLKIFVSDPEAIKGISLTLVFQPSLKDTQQFKIAYEEDDA